MKNNSITLACIAALSSCLCLSACSPAQKAIVDSQVPADVMSDFQCVTTELLQGALTDPAAILAACGSLLASQLLVLVENLLSAPSGTSLKLVKLKFGGHLPDVVLTAAQISRLEGIKTATTALIASGSK